MPTVSWRYVGTAEVFMVDWRRGGWTGSLRRHARREVRELLRENRVARRARYGLFDRVLRRFFSIGTFNRFVVGYIAVNLVFLVAEAVITAPVPSWLPTWTVPGPSPDLKALILNVGSYLLSAQVGVLGVISLALALITLIAQREGASTDIKVYYHESFAFEVVASCVALLAVLCVQLLWPAQFLLHRLGFGTELLVFKFGLLGVHLGWLLVNLAGLAHFIVTTFGFVQQSERERLRERYTANVVYPRDMTKRLRQQLYSLATTELIAAGSDGEQEEEDESGRPRVRFGIDYGHPRVVEARSVFAEHVILDDVHMVWVRWVLRRWINRCAEAENSPSETVGGLRQESPLIWFTLHVDLPVRGSVPWCCRRGGVPLTWLEKFVLRRAFRFARTGDAA